MTLPTVGDRTGTAASTAVAAEVPKLRRRARVRANLAGWAFVAPSTVALVVFVGIPIVAGLIISFTSWDMLTAPAFVGIDNYVDLVRDPLMWRSLLNTVYYAVLTIPGSMVIGLALALAVNRAGWAFKAYRTLFFIPVVSSAVAVSLMWKWVYNDDFGLFNWILRSVGLPAVGWLSDPNLALPSVAIVAIWKTMGYNMVFFLAGLQGIPAQLYEASAMDGAGWWARLWHITLPMLSPTTLFIAVVSVIGSFQVFDQVFVMTQGGPGNATIVYNYYLWQNAFQYFHMGYASALAYILFLLISIVTIFQVKIFNRRVVYDQI